MFPSIFKISLLAALLLLDHVSAKKPHGPIQEAIQNGLAAEYDRQKCIWRRGNDKDSCPDPDIRVFIYASDRPRRELDSRSSDWLRQDYDPTMENVLLVHGYAGGDDTLPIAVLRDAYLRNGSYNVFLVDWGALCSPPCYPAAVANLRPVAKCLAGTLTTLRDLGLPIARTTCVGHSLGAHICGIMANFLLFRMHRIIGLDPARPLLRPGYVNRLDSGDADFVEVIHTNAGYYGESGRMGHVDFCVNGGKVQPFCEDKSNSQLCSHVWVVCYMAESIDNDGQEPMAEPCSRRCPTGPRIESRPGEYVPMGQHTPIGTMGSFCYTGKYPPYCPKYGNGRGDERCCLPEDSKGNVSRGPIVMRKLAVESRRLRTAGKPARRPADSKVFQETLILGAAGILGKATFRRDTVIYNKNSCLYGHFLSRVAVSQICLITMGYP